MRIFVDILAGILVEVPGDAKEFWRRVDFYAEQKIDATVKYGRIFEVFVCNGEIIMSDFRLKDEEVFLYPDM
jgi:hypothetical protein